MKPTLLLFFFVFHVSFALLPFLTYSQDDVGLLEGECRDLAKNCHKQKKMCLSKIYVKVMQEKCAKTCGFCMEPEPVDQGKPEDIVDTIEEEIEEPTTEAVEIVEETELPEEAEIEGVSAEEVEVTDKLNTATTQKPKWTFAKRRPFSKKTACFDKLRDCGNKANLCRNKHYMGLMRNVCSKTCGICTSGLSKPAISTQLMKNRFASKKTLYRSCFDRGNDCRSKVQMCHVPSYRGLMSSQCKKTCGFC